MNSEERIKELERALADLMFGASVALERLEVVDDDSGAFASAYRILKQRFEGAKIALNK